MNNLLLGPEMEEVSDEDKLLENWNKAHELFEGGDWSASIMRVATSVEIAANIYVRRYLSVEHSLPQAYVDVLLFRANGVHNKFNNLILPALKIQEIYDSEILSEIKECIKQVNEHRNSIAHSGMFKSCFDAMGVFRRAEIVIYGLTPEIDIVNNATRHESVDNAKFHGEQLTKDPDVASKVLGEGLDTHHREEFIRNYIKIKNDRP